MSVKKKLMLIVAIVILERKNCGMLLSEGFRSAQYMNVKLPYLKPFFFGMHERRGYDPSSILTIVKETLNQYSISEEPCALGRLNAICFPRALPLAKPSMSSSLASVVLRYFEQAICKDTTVAFCLGLGQNPLPNLRAECA